MPVVAIEGYLGSGYQTIGRSVAEKLGIDFVDRVISEIAKEMDKHPAEIVDLQINPKKNHSHKELLMDC